MKVFFVLPKISRYPVGGYKMVYEYANRLCSDNIEITIIHLNEDLMKKYPIPNSIRSAIAHIITIIEPRWIKLDKRIKKISVMNSNGRKKETIDADYVIATAAQTVNFVNDNFLCTVAYYIQGYENWGLSIEDLHKTYRNNMRKIVISKWLKDIVDKYSPTASVLVQNPIDIAVYKKYKRIDERNEHTISLLYNELPIKGFEYAIKAIEIVQERFPDLQVYMFGRKKYSQKIPKWINYTKNATQKQTVQIYNNSRVYLCASVEEGFGLTGLEAMACGAVLVTTNFKGAQEYAIDDYNAMVSPVKDYRALAGNVIRVFEDLELAKRLSYNGTKTALDYSWDIAKDRFIYAITGTQGTY